MKELEFCKLIKDCQEINAGSGIGNGSHAERMDDAASSEECTGGKAETSYG